MSTKKNGDEEDRIALQRELGAELRQVFDRLIHEDVPAELRDLASKLDDRLAEPAARAATIAKPGIKDEYDA